jgi:hypothetical protein
VAPTNTSPPFALKRIVRPLSVGLGFALLAWLVNNVGPARVFEVMRASRRLLPAIVSLEAALACSDAVAAHVLLGAKIRVTASTWIRATAVAYASGILLPAGRLAGEAARAATLSRNVGLSRAIRACSSLQICTLVANVVMCVACILVMRRGEASTLVVSLAINAVLCGALAVALLGLLRHKRVNAWVQERFASLGDAGSSSIVSIGPGRTLAAQFICILGRAAQTAQYGVALFAVGGVLTPVTALTAQGVHLVGAAVGDFIPGQIGAMEGTYRVFAGAIGLRADLARALSIPLIVRVAQLIMTTVCLSAYAVARASQPTDRPGEEVP